MKDMSGESGLAVQSAHFFHSIPEVWDVPRHQKRAAEKEDKRITLSIVLGCKVVFNRLFQYVQNNRRA